MNKILSALMAVVLGASASAATITPVSAQTVPQEGNDTAFTPIQTYLPVLPHGKAETPKTDPLYPEETEGFAHDHSHDDYTMAEAARQRNEPAFQIDTRFHTAATAPADRWRLGDWSATFTWPFAFGSAANLPDGRIIAWGANNTTSFTGGNFTYASIWNPSTNTLTSVNHNNHSMFCAIPTMQEDGRIIVNGGDGDNPHTSSFDYRTNTWTRLEEMNTGRWYPGSLVLPNGKVFTMLGRPGGSYPELWTQNFGWSLLTGANLNNGVLNFTGYQSTWLPYVFLAPNGQVFHMGPTTQMNWIDPTGNGSISNAGLTNSWYPKYSGSIMYDEGKILVAGGAASSADTAPGTNQAMTIDLNGPTPVKTVITSMANARKFNNSVILPTGEVMIVGGNTSGVEFSDNGTILTPEIWNPDTRTWRAVADLSVPRNYHSVALLMTDGRVWSGGGGLCNCTADHPDHQVYSPPYLFNTDGTLATRPSITSAPTSVGYGRTFSVQASTGIDKFSLIKMSGVTHNLNSDLRFLKIPFTSPGSGQYALTLPSNPNVLTPGYWMLFAVNTAGVPSVAKVIQVVSTNSPSIANPGTQTTLLNNGVSLGIIASDPNGDVLSYSATGLPTGLSINNTSGVINGTATATGNYRPTISVSDGSNTISTSFDWVVTQPGTIRYVKLEALSEVAGNAWTSAAEVNVLDINNSTLNRAGWTATADSQETVGENGAVGNAIDGNNATIWHTQWQTASPPPPHWIVIDMKANVTVGGFKYLPRQDGVVNGRIGNYRFYVSADGSNWGQPVAQGTFANDATEKTVFLSANRAPTLLSPGNQSSAVGTAVNLALSASDPDGDVLSYSASGLPAGLTINSNSGVIAGTPSATGSSNVVVNVNDVRGGSASVAFTWAVNPPGLTINTLASSPKQNNTSVNYTASVNNAVNPRYKWLFGDGTAETAYSTSASASHAFAQPGLYVVKVTATDDRGVEQSTTFVQAIYLPSTPSRANSSMNIAFETRSGANNRVWVVNPDNDSVSVFDAVTNGKVAEINVGTAPRAIAIAPNGRVWVSNKQSATISIIDPGTLAVVQTVNLSYGAQPFGIAFAPNGSAGYVALEGAGKLLRFDPSTATQTGSLDVGANVRQLTVKSDSSRIYLSRFITPRVPGEETAAPQLANGRGEVLVIDVGTFTINKTMGLRHSDKPDTETAGRGIPNYLGALAISPDGVSGWLPSKLDNIARGTLRDGNNINFQNTVRAINSRIDISAEAEDTAARIDHDNAGVPSAAVFDKFGVYMFVALETNREVAVVDAYGKRELFRVAVGRAPQGLALSADGLRLYVMNFMDRSVSVLDISQLINTGKTIINTVATYSSVGTEKLSAQALKGKQFFYDAKDTRLARDSYISCAACHNDGGQDGRVWDLTGMGEGLRNTIALQGRTGAQGFLHWSGNFDEVQDFEGQIRALSGGTGLMADADFNTRNTPLGTSKTGVSADLDSLAAYVQSLNKFPSSPYRNADGTMTADAVAGRDIFRAANCAQCHGGTAFTNSGNATLMNIGTIKPSSGQRLGGALVGIDPPTLRDVWATGPYLHDGSAATLNEALAAHNNVSIAAADIPKLVAYLQQIDPQEVSAPTNLGSGAILREWWTNITGGTVPNLTSAAAYPYAPNGSGTLGSFEAPTNWADNYGTRIRGYVHAPTTGQYRFWIASDDYSELRLSTDANPANATVVASVPGWTNAREWTKYAQQKSALITLQAGQKYYIEAVQKEGTGGDNLAVGWEVPGQALTVIDGLYLSPYVKPVVSNVARGKATSQSSTYLTASASRAVDGNTNGNYSAGSVASTNSNTNAWWQVDLGASFTLDSIQVWNRTDCCANRLTNFYVFVSNTNMSGRSFSSLVGDTSVWRYYSAGQAPNKLDIPAYITGRYVRVQLAGTNYLSLAEVQVYGR